jgi:hypothetical protein
MISKNDKIFFTGHKELVASSVDRKLLDSSLTKKYGWKLKKKLKEDLLETYLSYLKYNY